MKNKTKHDQAERTWAQLRERARTPWMELTVDDFRKNGDSADKFYDANPLDEPGNTNNSMQAKRAKPRKK